MDINKAKVAWDNLRKIPTEKDCISMDFTVNGTEFKKGTDKYDIYQWIENTYDICIGDEFFGGKERRKLRHDRKKHIC